MKHRVKSMLAVSCLLVVSVCLSQQSVQTLEAQLAANPRDVNVLMNLGIAYHSQGVAGNEDAVDKGFACFDTLLSIEPTNAVALAFQGSLWTLRARDAWWPFTKMKYVDKGIDEMDKAVDLAPEDVSVRLTRGITSVNLPSMFHRLGTALKDFSFLLESAAFSHFDASLRGTIYRWAGVAYKQDGQTDKAKELLQKAIDVDPNSDNAKSAQQALKDLS